MLIHPQFDPVAIHLGPLAVHWYGLMYLLGFALFLTMGKYRLKNGNDVLTVPQLDDMLMYGAVGVVVGGRLGEVLFYQPGYYFSHPLEIFTVWKGGMSFHGGFLGVLIAVAIYGRKVGRGFWQLTDFSRRWCRWAWRPAASATSSTASCGAAWPTRTCRGRCCSRRRGWRTSPRPSNRPT